MINNNNSHLRSNSEVITTKQRLLTSVELSSVVSKSKEEPSLLKDYGGSLIMQYFFSQNHNKISEAQYVPATTQQDCKKSQYKLVIKRRDQQQTKSNVQENPMNDVEVVINQEEGTASKDDDQELLSQIKVDRSNGETLFQSQSPEDQEQLTQLRLSEFSHESQVDKKNETPQFCGDQQHSSDLLKSSSTSRSQTIGMSDDSSPIYLDQTQTQRCFKILSRHPTRGRLHYPRVLEQPVPKDPSKVMLKRKRAQLDGSCSDKPSRVCFNDLVDIFIYSKPSSERVSLTQSKQKSIRTTSNDYPLSNQRKKSLKAVNPERHFIQLSQNKQSKRCQDQFLPSLSLQQRRNQIKEAKAAKKESMCGKSSTERTCQKIDSLQRMIQTCGIRQSKKRIECQNDTTFSSSSSHESPILNNETLIELTKGIQSKSCFLNITNGSDQLQDDSSSTNADMEDPSDIETILQELNEFNTTV